MRVLRPVDSLTTAGIQDLRLKIVIGRETLRFVPRETYPLSLTPEQLEYLAQLLQSHITWREWLLPGEDVGSTRT